MEFLDKLVIPQSAEHLKLLHYLLMLIFFMFIPFIGGILGGTSISLYFRRKGTNEKNNLYLRFAKDIIELFTFRNSLGIILGVVPLLTAGLIYLQLLKDANAPTVTYLAYSLILLIISLALIYTYRYTVSFIDIFDSIKDLKQEDSSVSEEIKKYSRNNHLITFKAGGFGLAILLAALWIFSAGITFAAYPDLWGKNTLLGALFSGMVITHFVYLISVSFAVTGAIILFVYFYWDGGKENIDEAYKNLVRKVGVRVTLAATIILPVFAIGNLALLPPASLSFPVFGYAFASLLLLFIGYHLLYSMIKEKNTKFAGQLFFVVLFSVMALIIKNQLAMSNATELQTAQLNAKYNEMMAQLPVQLKKRRK